MVFVPVKTSDSSPHLSKRKQKVFVNGVESNFYLLKLGVPQGSILGPFLFIVHINDMVRATNYFTVRLFADDTSLTAVGSDLDVSIPFCHSMIILIILAVKISKSLNIIAKLKRHVTVQSIVSVYYALVHPYLTYGCILRG